MHDGMPLGVVLIRKAQHVVVAARITEQADRRSRLRRMEELMKTGAGQANVVVKRGPFRGVALLVCGAAIQVFFVVGAVVSTLERNAFLACCRASFSSTAGNDGHPLPALWRWQVRRP